MLRRAEASGCVYARSYAKADSLRIDGLISKTADLLECDQCRAVGVVNELHTVGNEEAVFTGETYNIGNGSDSGKVTELLKSHSVVAAVKSCYQLEGYTGAAHKLERREAVVSVRIDNSFRMGESFALLMVVCDDQLHTELIDEVSLRNSGNTVVNCNDKVYSVVSDTADSFFIESVALGAFRDIVCDICAGLEEIGVENDC